MARQTSQWWWALQGKIQNAPWTFPLAGPKSCTIRILLYIITSIIYQAFLKGYSRDFFCYKYELLAPVTHCLLVISLHKIYWIYQRTYAVKSEMVLLLKYNELKDLLFLKYLGWSYLEYATPHMPELLPWIECHSTDLSVKQSSKKF